MHCIQILYMSLYISWKECSIHTCSVSRYFTLHLYSALCIHHCIQILYMSLYISWKECSIHTCSVSRYFTLHLYSALCIQHCIEIWSRYSHSISVLYMTSKHYLYTDILQLYSIVHKCVAVYMHVLYMTYNINVCLETCT